MLNAIPVVSFPAVQKGEPMHHYPHHIGDYRTHTAHLTMVEDGAYRRLLDIYYMHEKPLPADVAAVLRLASARSREERAAVETILREYFTLKEDGWHQGRCDEEIDAYQERAEQARRNGKTGGRPKTRNKPRDNPAITDPVISGFPKHNPERTQTEPSEKLTVNRKPGTDNQEEKEEEGRGGALAPLPAVAAVESFNAAAEQAGWPRVQVLSAARKRALGACLHAVGGIDGFQSLLAKVTASDFLMGRTPRSDDHASWRFDFDFMLKKHVKIMEGGYGNSGKAPTPERGIGAVLAALADEPARH